MLTTPVNIKKMLDAQQLAINANVDVKAGETQTHVTTKANATNVEVANKATDTQDAIVNDGDVTQAKLDAITVVSGDISTDVQAINAHTDAQLAALNFSPVKSVQRGYSVFSILKNEYIDITVAAVNVDKTLVNMQRMQTANQDRLGFSMIDGTTLRIINTNTSYTITAKINWELIEYV